MRFPARHTFRRNGPEVGEAFIICPSVVAVDGARREVLCGANLLARGVDRPRPHRRGCGPSAAGPNACSCEDEDRDVGVLDHLVAHRGVNNRSNQLRSCRPSTMTSAARSVSARMTAWAGSPTSPTASACGSLDRSATARAPLLIKDCGLRDTQTAAMVGSDGEIDWRIYPASIPGLLRRPAR